MPHRALLSAFLLCAALAARAEPPPLDAYGRLPVMEHVTLSPLGDRYAFAATVGGKRSIYVRTVAGEPLAVVGVDAVKVRELEWAGELYVVATISAYYNMRLEWGNDWEIPQMSAINVDTRRIRPLLQAGGAVNAVLGHYGFSQEGPKWYAYLGAWHVSHDLTGEHVDDYDKDLVRVDLETGTIRQVIKGRWQGADWLVDPAGEILATARYEDKKGMWTLYGGGPGGRLLARKPDPHHRNDIIGPGRASGTVLYAVHDEAGAVTYLEQSLVAPTGPVQLFADTERVERFIFDPVSRLLVGVESGGDVPEMQMLDPAREKRVQATRKAFPRSNVRFASWDRTFDRMAVHTDGPGDPGTWWFVDIATGHADEMGSDYPGVPSEWVGPVKMVDYRAADGLPEAGVLTLPPNRAPKNLPVVVMPHGGPEARDYPRFDWLAQAFASRGYAVWQPNFRGSAGYGVAFRNAGHGEWGGKMQTDISDGLAELVRLGIVDPRRACIVGASYGGYAALAGVTLQQGLYRCAVSIAGVSDLVAQVRDARDRSGESAARYWLDSLGAKSIGDDVVEARSPVHFADRADAPVLLVHGRDDTRVAFSQSVAMKKALEAAEKPVELVALKGEDHFLSREETRKAMLQVAVAFVLEKNPP